MNRADMLQQAYDAGFTHEHDAHGCAQCTIAAIQDVLNIRNDYVYKCASGLAAGAGECTDGLCGGYSGAIMMMSLFYGRTRDEEATAQGKEDRHVSSRMAAALHEKFLEKYGTVICAEIHKKIYGRAFNLRDEKEKQMFHEVGAHEREDGCCSVVGNGTRWAVELLLHEFEKQGVGPRDFDELIYPKS